MPWQHVDGSYGVQAAAQPVDTRSNGVTNRSPNEAPEIVTSGSPRFEKPTCAAHATIVRWGDIYPRFVEYYYYVGLQELKSWIFSPRGGGGRRKLHHIQQMTDAIMAR